MMISSALIAMIMKHQSVGVSGGVFALFSYALPYILYTEPAKAKKLTPPPETKAVAKPDGFPNY
jgi:hypothetical protein